MDNRLEATKRLNRAMVIIVVVFTALLIYKILSYGWEVWTIPVGAAATALLCVAHFKSFFNPKIESYVINAVAILYLFYFGIHENVFDYNYPMVLGVYIMATAAFNEYAIVVAGVVSYFAAFFCRVLIVQDVSIFQDKFLPLVLMITMLIYCRYSIRKHIAEVKESTEAFAEIEKERRDREDFLANVSHELRTPVNAIIGMTDSMLKSDLSGERRNEAIAIDYAGKRLLRQIEDILDYSELLSNRMKSESAVYSFKSLLDDIKRAADHVDSKNSLSISYDIARDIPSLLKGDARKIQHCMRNIIENAIKYTEDGSVTIRAFSRKETYGVNLTFVVEDTGVGMDAETIDKTYGRYFNTGEEGVIHSDGLRLGLIVSRGLVSAMDGFINIESVPGKGTRVSVTLPQGVESYDHWEREIQAMDEPAPDLSGRKILIVDDEPMNLAVAERVLSAYNNPITETADGGNAAVEKCRQTAYDIIFMDHMMPDMDGIETFKVIRSDDTSLNRKTPIIALTANVVSGAREMFLSEGFSEFVAKPIERTLLERAINKVCKDLPPIISAPQEAPQETQVTEPVSEEPASQKPEQAQSEPSGEPEASQVEENQSPNEGPAENMDPVSFLTSKGVNTGAALTYCADSPDFYLMMLTDFYGSIKDRAEELDGFMKSEDYDNYRIKVHALKSNTKTLGFDEMSEAALASETALKEGNNAVAVEMHEDIIKKLSEVEAVLKEIL